MEFRLPMLFWGRQRGCLPSTSKIKPSKESRLLEEMRAKTTSSSPDKASKSIMSYYPQHQTFPVSQGGPRSFEASSVKMDPYNIPRTPREKHRRQKMTVPQDQLAQPSSYQNYNPRVGGPNLDKLQPGQWSDEHLSEDGTYTYRAKMKLDGTYPFTST